jgi:two-component system, cell cycle sensor histidine kinase and response regulator CckA
MRTRAVELNSAIVDVEKMLRRVIGEDIDFVTALDPQLGTVRADPSQIVQVILNLAVNARDAMPQGGQLTVETRNVEIDLAHGRELGGVPAGSYVCMSMTDTGTGMDAATKQHVFEPFFTTKPVGKGTGLGLSTVFGIVKQTNGGIEIDSLPGHGSTFRIYLPRMAPAASDSRLGDAAPRRG